MKIKISQLRKIIREEVERSLETSPSGIAATIADKAGVGTPKDFAGVSTRTPQQTQK